MLSTSDDLINLISSNFSKLELHKEFLITLNKEGG